MEIVFSLLLTIAFEGLVLILLQAQKKVILLSIIINTITNIPLNLFITNYLFDSLASYVITIIFLEIVITLFEAILYLLITKDLKKAFKYSFYCNSVSYFIGLLLSILYVLI